MSARQDLGRLLAEAPGAIVEDVARTQNATACEVVEALPEQMRKFAPGGAFIEAMQDIGGWGDVTLIVHTDDGIMEFGGPVPVGEVGRDEKRELKTDQLEKFRALVDRLCN